MHFTFLTALYSSYVDAFYAARPGLARQTYAQQKSALDRDGFGWNGAWEPALRPLGYEVQSLYANVEPLQRAWATEQSIAWPGLGWMEIIARRQIEMFCPDILLLDNLSLFRRPWLERGRVTCPRLRLILGYSGVYLPDFETVKASNAIFSCARRSVEYFRQGGGRAFLLRHAFNAEMLERLPARTTQVDELLFAGSIARGVGSHLEREQLIEGLVGAVPVSIYCPQGEIPYPVDWLKTGLRRSLYCLIQSLRRAGVPEPSLHRMPGIGRATHWMGMPLSQINPRLRSRMKPPLYGIAIFTSMRDHAVTLNKHIDMAFAEAGNARLFEATGAGACLLTDWKENLHEMFEPDYEVAVYRSNAECIEKARWLLQHPVERNAMAAAGQARVLRSHTFTHRAAELDQLIRSELQ